MRFSRTHTRAGLTLVELLTVIAIIGILATLLIPTVGSIIDRARLTDSASRLRGLQTAILAYTQEHKGALPPVHDSSLGPGNYPWTLMIWEYIVGESPASAGYTPAQMWAMKGAEPLFCPTWGETVINECTGYGMNLRLGLPSLPDPNEPGGRSYRVAQLDDISRRILLGTANNYMIDVNTWASGTPSGTGAPIDVDGILRHTGGGNYVMVDGSVMQLPYDEARARLLDPSR